MKTHASKKSIEDELNTFLIKLRKYGYFFSNQDSLVTKENYIAYFSLRRKIDSVQLTGFSLDQKKNISIKSLYHLLDSTSKSLEEKGFLFSKVQLKNITTKKGVLFADLSIKESYQRKVDKIITKGYDKISNNYIKRQLSLKKETIVNKNKLNELSDDIKRIKFISETRQAEVLFSKDSTLLYLYLKKERRNNFDGLLNFNTDNTSKKILFTGHLNLELNNNLNYGESFSLLWKANGNQNQNLNINNKIPYIFNTAISSELNFNIYKQDSTFLSTKFSGKLFYGLNNKSSLGVSFTSEESLETLENNTLNVFITSYNSFFTGIIYKLNSKEVDFFNNEKFSFEINPNYGLRNNEQQFKVNLKSHYTFEIGKKTSIFIANQLGILHSKSFFLNELFRIGGVNSLRGFNEESIFTSIFSFFNSEFRYLTSNDSYLYSITDFGYFKPYNDNSYKNAYSIGLGYTLRIKNSTIDINYTLGKTTYISTLDNNSRISITYKNFF